MLTPYKGTLYRGAADPAVVELVESDELHTMDYDDVLAFYRDFVHDRGNADLAYLGAVDRYFLLTNLLGRFDAFHPWLYDRCREVELEPDGFLDLWSRFHYKSSIITFAGVAQEIINDPEVTVGIFSHTKGIASKFVAQLKREFEGNQDIRSIYPDICWVKPRSEAPKWSDSEFIVRRKGNPKEATVEGHGVVDGQPTSKHFKVLIYDDLVTLESVNTPEQVKKTTEAFELSTNLGTANARRWMIGTRYSFGDSYGTLMERGVVVPRIYPATHNGKPDGKPVLLTPEEWEQKKKEQASTMAAQLLQNPLTGKERMFNPTWYKPWFVRPASMNVYIMADPSRGRTAKSDRTAIAVIGLDSAGNKYLLDGARHRMKLSQRWDHLKHFYQKWVKVPGVNFVKVGYERYGQQSDDEYFMERQRADKISFAIEELAWPREGGNSKRDRVERLQPDVQFGSFFFPGLVWRSGKVCTWQVSDDGDRMEFRELKDIMKDHAVLKARGQEYLCAKQITRRDEENKVYDLTVELMDEMNYFPFGLHDDLVDVTSRIYDMEAVAASMTDVLPDEPETVD